MRWRATGGITAQPKRRPVAAKLFDAASSMMVYGATSAQTATFSVSGGLSTGEVHVWSTDLNSQNPADYTNAQFTNGKRPGVRLKL